MEKPVKLMQHNIKPYKSIVSKFQLGCNRVLYCAGTGTGKSYVAKALLETLFINDKTMYVVPTLAIASYLSKEAGFDIYTDRVTFVTYKSFQDYDKAEERLKDFSVVILDEAHHIGSEQSGANIQKLMKEKDIRFFGMTATPSREDNIDVSLYFDAIVHGLTIFNAIKQNLMPVFDYLVCSPKIDRLTPAERRKAKINYATSFEFLKDIITTCPKNKWLAFFSSVKQLEEVKPIIKSLFPDYEVLTLHSTIDESPFDILEAQRKFDKVVLLSCDMLLEGLHTSDVDGILLFRNVQSLTVFQQILGRVSSIGKHETPLIIDCTEAAYKMLHKLLSVDKHKSSTGKFSNNFSTAVHTVLNVSLEISKYYDTMFLLEQLDVHTKKNLPLDAVGESLCPSPKFYVKNLCYNSLEDFCKQSGISAQYLNKVAEDNNWSTEEAASAYLDTNAFIFFNKPFRNRNYACKRLGIPVSAVTKIKKDYNLSDEDAMLRYVMTMAGNTSTIIVYGGVVYDDLFCCCNKLHIDVVEVIRFITQHRTNCIDAITNVLTGISTDGFSFLGNTYTSYTACCKELNIPGSSIEYRLVHTMKTLYDILYEYIEENPSKYSDLIDTVKEYKEAY